MLKYLQHSRKSAFFRLFLIVALLVGLASGTYARSMAQSGVQAIIVDTILDSSDPIYQACTEAPDDCSLRGAITKANHGEVAAQNIIEIPAGVYTLALSGSDDNNAAGDLDIKHDLIVRGSGNETTVVDGNGLDRIFDILANTVVEISGVRITGGKTSDRSHGGGVFNRGRLALIGCVIEDNSARDGISPGEPGGDGGGIYNDGVSNLVDCAIRENSSGEGTGKCFNHGGSGGGIFNNGLLAINNSVIANNHAERGSSGQKEGDGCQGGNGGSGGGIYNNGTLTFTVGLIEGNDAGEGGIGGWVSNLGQAPTGASGIGGAIVNNGKMMITQGVIRHNHTSDGGEGWASRVGVSGGLNGGDGGGVYNVGVLNITQSLIKENLTGNGGPPLPVNGSGNGGEGGGIFNTGTLTITGSDIQGNRTGQSGDDPTCGSVQGGDSHGGSGGGIYNIGSLVIVDSMIHYNRAGDGGLFSHANVINGNDGGSGGGIFTGGETTILRSSIISNTAGDGGIDCSLFDEQQKGRGGNGGSGGGLYIETTGGDVNLVNVMIAKNSAGAASATGYVIDMPGDRGSPGHGSGVSVNSSSPRLFHTTIAENSGGDGSGIYAASSMVSLYNTILVSHTVGVTVTSDSAVRLDATLWGSGLWSNQRDWGGGGAVITGTQNYWGNPLFVDPVNLNYHIGVESAAKDRGIYIWVNTDIDNWPRPDLYSARPDLGADEFWSTIPLYLPLLQLIR